MPAFLRSPVTEIEARLQLLSLWVIFGKRTWLFGNDDQGYRIPRSALAARASQCPKGCQAAHSTVEPEGRGPWMGRVTECRRRLPDFRASPPDTPW